MSVTPLAKVGTSKSVSELCGNGATSQRPIWFPVGSVNQIAPFGAATTSCGDRKCGGVGNVIPEHEPPGVTCTSPPKRLGVAIHSLPSVPEVIPAPLPVKRQRSDATPSVDMRPALLVNANEYVNQSAPSEPVVIPYGERSGESGANSVISPGAADGTEAFAT